MDLSSSPTIEHPNAPSLQFFSFLFVPFQNHAVQYSADRSVILNEVKDLTKDN